MDILTIISVSATLVKAGVATYQQIHGAIAANQTELQLTDDQLNEILDAMIKEDTRRAEIAEKEARGGQ